MSAILAAVCSSAHGSPAVIEHLKAKLGMRGKLDSTPSFDVYVFFSSAVSAKNTEVMKYLYENSTDRTKLQLRAHNNYACLKETITLEYTEGTDYLWSVMTSQEKSQCGRLSGKVFCVAAKMGNLFAVREWYDRAGTKLKISLVEDNDWEAFRMAAQQGHLPVVQYLWSIASAPHRKAMLKAANYHAVTTSCANGHLDVVQYLASVSSFTNCEYGAVAFAVAAGENRKNVVDFLWKEFVKPKRKLEVLEYRNMNAFALALRSNHMEMVRFLLRAGEKVRLKASAEDRARLFRDAVLSRDLHTVQFWFNDMLPEHEQRQRAVRHNGFSAFNAATCNNDVEIARFLISVADPAVGQEMLLYQNCFVFLRAVANAHLHLVQLMCENISTANLSSLLTNSIIVEAAECGRLEILTYFHRFVSEDALMWSRLVACDSYRAVARAMTYGQVNAARFLMRTCASCFAHTEIHSHEFDVSVTSAFVADLYAELRNRQDSYQLINPNGVFDVADPNEAILCFYLLKYELRRRCNVDNILFLLQLPSVRASAHLPMSPHAPINELLNFARNRRQSCGGHPAEVSLAIAILLSIPAVAMHDQDEPHSQQENDFSHPPLTILHATAANRESSMVGLTQEEESRLHHLLQLYAPPGSVPHTLAPLRAELEKRYKQNPATVLVLNKVVPLPLSRADFDALQLPSFALKAYYSHPDHTALRYISKPNLWLHARADYLPAGELCSTFQQYSTLIAVLFAAASDPYVPATDGYTAETRMEQFIQELALIGRAHNWDHSRARVDRPSQSEEYDDLEGDRPSCFSGVKRRLFQSVRGHPLMDFVTPEMLTEELRGFARDHFARHITPALKLAWNAYVISLDCDSLIALDALNVPLAAVSTFAQSLKEKYGTHLSHMIETHAQRYFQLSHVYRNHVAKLAGTTGLNNLFDRIS